MAQLQACNKCGAQLDTSDLAQGTAFTCGSCGHVLRAGSGVTPPSAAPPLPRTRTAAPTRALSKVRRANEDPTSRARVNAAKMCATCLYAGITGAVTIFLFGAIASAAVGVFGIVVGIRGLTRLAKLGPGDTSAGATPLERVGAKMARRAKPQAVSGLVICACLLALPVVTILYAKSQDEKRLERQEELERRFEEYLRDR